MQLNRENISTKERFAFRLWRQTVRKLIYKAKTHYFNTHINENLNNHGTVSENSQVHMLVQIYLTFKTAYVFNTHFCNIYRYISSNSINSPDFTTLQHVHKFTIPLVSVQFVEKQLKHLDTRKTTGIDNVSAKYFKMSAAIVAPILVHIFNCCIKSFSFPTLFKKAKVMPIYKKGDKSVMSNNRPISMLPVISLIFERHVNLHVKAFLGNNMLLYNRQSGFRENLAVIIIWQLILLNLNQC